MKVRQGSLWCHGTTKPHVVRLCGRIKILLVPFFLDFTGFLGLLPAGCPIP